MTTNLNDISIPTHRELHTRVAAIAQAFLDSLSMYRGMAISQPWYVSLLGRWHVTGSDGSGASVSVSVDLRRGRVWLMSTPEIWDRIEGGK